MQKVKIIDVGVFPPAEIEVTPQLAALYLKHNNALDKGRYLSWEDRNHPIFQQKADQTEAIQSQRPNIPTIDFKQEPKEQPPVKKRRRRKPKPDSQKDDTIFLTN